MGVRMVYLLTWVYVWCVFDMGVRMVYLLTWVYVWCIFLCFEQNRLKIQTRLD